MSQDNESYIEERFNDRMEYEEIIFHNPNQLIIADQIQEEQPYYEYQKQEESDLESIKNYFKSQFILTGQSLKLNQIKTFLINQSDNLDQVLEKADELLKSISTNKGFNYDDEVNLSMKMDNLDPYPPLIGSNIELSYLANLNSRFFKVCRQPEFQDIFEEPTISNYDYSEIRTDSNRLTFKKNLNDRGEMVSYGIGGRLPQPMKEILKLQTDQLKDIRQNTLVKTVSFQHDKGESLCIQFKVILGQDNTNEDLHAIRVDEMQFKEGDSEMGSLMWGGSNLGDQNQIQSLNKQYRSEDYYQDKYQHQ